MSMLNENNTYVVLGGTGALNEMNPFDNLIWMRKIHIFPLGVSAMHPQICSEFPKLHDDFLNELAHNNNVKLLIQDKGYGEIIPCIEKYYQEHMDYKVLINKEFSTPSEDDNYSFSSYSVSLEKN